MLCVIPGANLKVFAKAIHSLAKIGDEIYFEAAAGGLSVRTVNSSRSAFSTFFFKPSFFIKYQHKSSGKDPSNGDDDDDGGAIEDDEEEDKGCDIDSLKCKVYTKSCLTVFKGGASMEKQVDRCRISLDPDADRFVFTLFCRYGLVKTFKLTYSECEKLKAVFSTETCTNRFSTQSKLLTEVVSNFQSGVEEMKVSMSQHTVTFRNHLDHSQEASGGCVKTEVIIHSNEFDEYSFNEETVSVFCLKEFRAFLFFCEMYNLEVSVFADHAGKPIIFCLDTDPSFECCLVLATVASEYFSGIQNVSKEKETKLKKTKRKRKSVEEEVGEDASVIKQFDQSNLDAAMGTSGDEKPSDGASGDGAFKRNGGAQYGDVKHSSAVNGKDDDAAGDAEVTVADSFGDEAEDGADDNDVVEASPPREPANKKLKSIFCGLSQSPEQGSFNKSHMVVLAEDSESD